jgi:hypothetical protein
MNTKGMEVRVRRPCRECGAVASPSGLVQHPEWAAYWADAVQQSSERAYLSDGNHEGADWAFKSWWRKRGYDPDGEGGLPIPPEEIACPECDGERVVEEWVPLEKLLRPVYDGLSALDSVVLGRCS